MSIYQVEQMDAEKEALFYYTPDKSDFDKAQHNREIDAVLTAILAAVPFKDEETHKKVFASILDSIAPPKFIAHHVNPYTKEIDEEKRKEHEKIALSKREK